MNKTIKYTLAALTGAAISFYLMIHFTKPTNRSTQINSENTQNQDDRDDEIFKLKNEIAKLKLLPSTYKDTISLLMLTREIENKIGMQSDFSDDFIALFSLTLKIPGLQEEIVQYKAHLYQNLYQIPTNSKLLSELNELENTILKASYTNQQTGSINNVIAKVKYAITKNIRVYKPDNAILKIKEAIKLQKYQEAMSTLSTIDSTKINESTEYKTFESNLSYLANTEEMLDKIYKVIKSYNE